VYEQPSPTIPDLGGFLMTKIHATPAQKEILRLVASFKGLFGPLAIEAAMNALSHCPESEWAPLVNHLEALMGEGLIRFDESSGAPRVYITTEGERAS
jgi:hypothetical protein